MRARDKERVASGGIVVVCLPMLLLLLAQLVGLNAAMDLLGHEVPGVDRLLSC